MILLGLGTNLGDRKANLEAALAHLGHGDGAPVRLLRVSSVYESAAMLPEDAPEDWDIPYYNIVVAGESSLGAEALLDAVKRIERALGRQDVGRWGPRIIDIDILAYGDSCHHSEALTVPHAAMLERDFVMLPLAEILPHWRYPVATGEEALTASDVVRRKGMAQGEGLLRLPLTLRWEVRSGGGR